MLDKQGLRDRREKITSKISISVIPLPAYHLLSVQLISYSTPPLTVLCPLGISRPLILPYFPVDYPLMPFLPFLADLDSMTHHFNSSPCVYIPYPSLFPSYSYLSGKSPSLNFRELQACLEQLHVNGENKQPCRAASH